MSVQRGYYYVALESVFGVEWLDLSRAKQKAVYLDLVEACEALKSMSARDYYNGIGKGNLAPYADCLIIASER